MAIAAALSMRDALPIWWRVARQWFTGKDRWHARWYVLASTVLACSTTWLAVHISYTQKHFSTALAEKNEADWKAAVWEFVVIILIAAPLKALEFYTEKRLVAIWRAALSQAFITAYTSNRSYFHMQLARGTEGVTDASEHQLAGQEKPQPLLLELPATAFVNKTAAGLAADKAALQLTELSSKQQQLTATEAVGMAGPNDLCRAARDTAAEVDRAMAGTPSKPAYSSTPVAGLSLASAAVDNPDQRITADVANFVSTSVSLVLLLGKKTLNCLAFAGVLWSISHKLVVFLLCYAFMGTFGTAWIFGRPLTRLQQKILKLEADLRFGLVRLRENAEAIAFYGGDEREATHLSQRLTAMLGVLLQRISWLGGYELWVNAYSYATILLPSLVLAPEYFQGKIPFGTLTQASYAFTTLEAALGLILARLDDFSSLAAETARLDGLIRALEAADVDAGGNGTAKGFEPNRAASSVAEMLGLLGQTWVWGWKRKVARKGAEREGSTQATADVDADGVNVAVGEATRLLVPESSSERLGTPTSRRVSAAAADGQQERDSSSGSGSTAVMDDGGSSGGASAGRPSRVLRLVDGTVPGFSVEDLSAWVPGKHHRPTCVCTDLSFSLAPGESLLVMGPSGCGKSSLLRVIAGLWTVGSGTVRGPATQELFFLPQKPFMPLGNLRQQLMFPAAWANVSSSAHNSMTAAVSPAAPGQITKPALSHIHGSHSSNVSKLTGAVTAGGAAAAASAANSTCINVSSLSSSACTDHQLVQLLEAVKLRRLLHRFDMGLDAEVDWSAVLSMGEQQRVAICRMLYHKPQIAFLDEATAALDPNSEAVVYGLVRHACSSYISVGHRMQLLEWHSHVLVSIGQGHWVKYTAAEYKQRLAAGTEI